MDYIIEKKANINILGKMEIYTIMVKFIVLVIAIAALWIGYTNWGKPLNVDNAVKRGTSSIKTEKSIDRVINSRENTAEDNKKMLDNI